MITKNIYKSLKWFFKPEFWDYYGIRVILLDLTILFISWYVRYNLSSQLDFCPFGSVIYNMYRSKIIRHSIVLVSRKGWWKQNTLFLKWILHSKFQYEHDGRDNNSFCIFYIYKLQTQKCITLGSFDLP